MSQFITFPLSHPSDPMQDCQVKVHHEDIRGMREATQVDRKQREEINTLVLTRLGTYATSVKMLELEKQINSNF